VRACTPAPGAWTTFRGKRVKLGPVEPVDGVGLWPIVEALVPAPMPCDADVELLDPRLPPEPCCPERCPVEPDAWLLEEPPWTSVRNDCVASDTAVGTFWAVSIALERTPSIRCISDWRASPALAMICS